MLERIRGVMSLDADTFREIENDPKALGQAFIIVVVSSLLAALSHGFGNFGQVMFGVGLGASSSSTFRVLAVAGWAIVAWILWSVLTQVIGTHVFKGQATIPEMMRVIGFAYAPLAIQVLSFIPIVGIFAVWGAAVWSIAAAYVGIREGLDLETGKTLITVLIGWVAYLIGMGILLRIL